MNVHIIFLCHLLLSFHVWWNLWCISLCIRLLISIASWLCWIKDTARDTRNVKAGALRQHDGYVTSLQYLRLKCKLCIAFADTRKATWRLWWYYTIIVFTRGNPLRQAGWCIWCLSWVKCLIYVLFGNPSQIARFMGPTWGPPGAERTQVDPMLAPWTLLSGMSFLETETFREIRAFPLTPLISWLLMAC